MAFSEKRRFVRHLGADIAVIPECSKGSIESPDGDGFDCLWFGENTKKGLGVLVAKPWRILDYREPQSRWIAPIWIGGPNDFLLLAVWTARIKESLKRSYIGQACMAVEGNPEWFDGRPVVMCGDFNSNVIWDGKRESHNHSFLVRFLAERNIVSAYHHFFAERQGEEKRPTHYFYHRKNRGFHIDHVFLPESWAQQISNFEVGKYGKWAKVSDHVPLIVDVNLRSSVA